MLKKKILNKFNYYCNKMTPFFSKPEKKFLKEMILGILKSKTVILRQIAVELQENIPLEKITNRLRNHLSKKKIWKKITENHISSISTKIKDDDYGILDITDIQKKYAEDMEGLDKVRDGDKKTIGKGYWIMNVLRINKLGNEITPLYKKLYSFCKGTLSENIEILSAIRTVEKKLQKKLKWVIDRGGDRKKLIIPFIKEGKKFVIRLVGNRKLYYKGKLFSISKISRKVDLNNKLRQIRYYGNKAVKIKFNNP